MRDRLKTAGGGAGKVGGRTHAGPPGERGGVKAVPEAPVVRGAVGQRYI
jgi:hypothetical protein